MMIHADYKKMNVDVLSPVEIRVDLFRPCVAPGPLVRICLLPRCERGGQAAGELEGHDQQRGGE